MDWFSRLVDAGDPEVVWQQSDRLSIEILKQKHYCCWKEREEKKGKSFGIAGFFFGVFLCTICFFRDIPV